MTSARLMTTRGRLHVQQNERRKAMLALRSSLAEVQRSETETMTVLRTIASQVKGCQHKNKSMMRDLLSKSRTQRIKLGAIIKKRTALQQHLETLETSELNQQVLSSVKQTSDVLKSMDLAQKLESVDELMIEMNESHDDMQSIQLGLGSSYGSDAQDEDLEQELALLIADDDADIHMPPQNNSMHASPSPAALSQTQTVFAPIAERPPVPMPRRLAEPADPEPSALLQAEVLDAV